MLDGAISHDKITRFLGSEDFDAKSLWKMVKPMVRKYERDDGVLIVDDTIEEKPYTDESELVCWHYDHSKGRSIKGINMVNVLYQTEEIHIPVNYHLVEKDLWVWNKKKEKEVRKSRKTKNEHMRDMLKKCKENHIKFRYVLADIWYGSAENMKYIAKDLQRFFIVPLKSNRNVALSLADKDKGLYQTVGDLALEQGSIITIYLEGLDFPLHLTKLIFKNEDDSEAVLYLVTTDLTIDADTMDSLYQKRWGVGVSDEGHIIQSVQVRPRLKDSSLVAWETPWRESKTVMLSDKILERRMGNPSGCNSCERRGSLVTRKSGGRDGR